MWIHLLSLGLVDGASPAETPVPPEPPVIQYGAGGGGGGRGLRELIEKLFKEETKPASILAAIVPESPTPERVEAVVKAVRQVVRETRNTDLKLASQVINELLKRHAELEDEESAVVSLLLA